MNGHKIGNNTAPINANIIMPIAKISKPKQAMTGAKIQAKPINVKMPSKNAKAPAPKTAVMPSNGPRKCQRIKITKMIITAFSSVWKRLG